MKTANLSKLKPDLRGLLIRRLQSIAYNGLYVGATRFNDVRMSPAGLQGRDAYTGAWSLLDVEEMTDCNGRKVTV